MRNFKELVIWQKAHSLCLKIYEVTAAFPKTEIYGITSQMRRSASSIPTNIAEGCGRRSNPDFCRFLIIAAGSASELEYQILLSTDLKFITLENFKLLTKDVIEIRKMIYSFCLKLE